MLKVEDIMTSEFVSVSLSTPIIEVAHQMGVSGTGIISVCDKGKFRGVITERDIVVGIVATATDPVTEPASSVLNDHHPVISPGEELIQAAKLMAAHNVQVLAVAQNDRLLGLLTLDDLARESLALAATVLAERTRAG